MNFRVGKEGREEERHRGNSVYVIMEETIGKMSQDRPIRNEVRQLRPQDRPTREEVSQGHLPEGEAPKPQQDGWILN